MRNAITLLTAAAFVLHFTLDCCGLHAQAADGAGNAAFRAAAHEDREASNHSPGECPRPGEDFHEGHADFVLCAKIVLVKSTFVVLLPELAAAPAAETAACQSHRKAAAERRGRIAPPVRAHLFNQVLLI